MNALQPAKSTQNKEIVALLCISDSGEEAPLALTPLYGQPFVHHLVKTLESQGIKRFFIGIDSVPGALLTYCDAARNAGLDIGFVRNPGDMAEHINDDVLVLVQTADSLWDSALLGEALAKELPLLATVEEQAENQQFERIDLNSRWAGLALLERRNLAPLTALPEGWDIGSALLRQALQDGVARWPVGQKQIQSGRLKKLVRIEDVAGGGISFDSLQGLTPKTLEKYVFVPLVKRFLPNIWLASWSRPLVEWVFLGLAALSAILACLNFPIIGAVIAIVAVFCAMLRHYVRAVEYRSDTPDWLGKLGWALLAFAFGAVLFHAEISRPEGGFVWLSALALSMFAREYWTSRQYWLTSPLVLALAATLGQLAGWPGWAIRLVILAELALLLLASFHSSNGGRNTSERA